MPDESKKRTTDERIDAITMNLELLSSQVQDLATTTAHNFKLALDSIKRLENIALAHSQMLDEHDAPIEKLEDGK